MASVCFQCILLGSQGISFIHPFIHSTKYRLLSLTSSVSCTYPVSQVKSDLVLPLPRLGQKPLERHHRLLQVRESLGQPVLSRHVEDAVDVEPTKEDEHALGAVVDFPGEGFG